MYTSSSRQSPGGEESDSDSGGTRGYLKVMEKRARREVSGDTVRMRDDGMGITRRGVMTVDTDMVGSFNRSRD